MEYKCINISKTYHKFAHRSDTKALENINLTLKSGEIIGVVGLTNSGKTTLVDILSGETKPTQGELSYNPSSVVRTYKPGHIKLNKNLTIVDTPGFIDDDAIYNFVEYNKTLKFYPKKEIRVKTFQVRNSYAIVVNDILRIENISDKFNSFSFYMSENLRYEKVKSKNEKLTILPDMTIEITEPTDILINGLGFVRITKPGRIKVYALDSKLITYRKSMI